MSREKVDQLRLYILGKRKKKNEEKWPESNRTVGTIKHSNIFIMGVSESKKIDKRQKVHGQNFSNLVKKLIKTSRKFYEFCEGSTQIDPPKDTS